MKLQVNCFWLLTHIHINEARKITKRHAFCLSSRVVSVYFGTHEVVDGDGRSCRLRGDISLSSVISRLLVYLPLYYITKMSFLFEKKIFSRFLCIYTFTYKKAVVEMDKVCKKMRLKIFIISFPICS